MPMQTIGGADIRMFSADGKTLLWQVYGTYVDNADADPASGGTSMFVNGKHYTMDYSKVPGKSTSFTGVTLDPFRFPNDPRVRNQFESPWVRRINGQKFLYLTNMYGGELYILRFEPNSEIAIPAAFIGLINTNLDSSVTALHPTWDVSTKAIADTNKRIRWWWRDGDGDGDFQPTEFGLWDNWTIYSRGIDIDDAGGIWYGGDGQVDTYFRGGGIQYWPCTGIDANGVPIYDFAKPQRIDVPVTVSEPDVTRLKYLSASDTIFLGASNNYDILKIYRYDHFLDKAKQKLVYSIDLGYNDFGVAHIELDGNANSMTLPRTFTADEDYVYVAYLSQGKEGRKRGEVTVYDAKDGHEVGWIVPGDEVGGYCGAVDLVNGINVTTDAAGWKIVTLEDDGAAKVMAYRWQPPSASRRRAAPAAVRHPRAVPRHPPAPHLRVHLLHLAPVVPARAPVPPAARVLPLPQAHRAPLVRAVPRRAAKRSLLVQAVAAVAALRATFSCSPSRAWPPLGSPHAGLAGEIGTGGFFPSVMSLF